LQAAQWLSLADRHPERPTSHSGSRSSCAPLGGSRFFAVGEYSTLPSRPPLRHRLPESGAHHEIGPQNLRFGQGERRLVPLGAGGLHLGAYRALIAKVLTIMRLASRLRGTSEPAIRRAMFPTPRSRRTRAYGVLKELKLGAEGTRTRATAGPTPWIGQRIPTTPPPKKNRSIDVLVRTPNGAKRGRRPFAVLNHSAFRRQRAR
jgi:hypothetical protein